MDKPKRLLLVSSCLLFLLHTFVDNGVPQAQAKQRYSPQENTMTSTSSVNGSTPVPSSMLSEQGTAFRQCLQGKLDGISFTGLVGVDVAAYFQAWADAWQKVAERLASSKLIEKAIERNLARAGFMKRATVVVVAGMLTWFLLVCYGWSKQSVGVSDEISPADLEAVDPSMLLDDSESLDDVDTYTLSSLST